MLEVGQCQAGESPLLDQRNRLEGSPCPFSSSGLDFDKDQRVSVATDQVDFSLTCAIPAFDNRHPQFDQVSLGQFLAVFTQSCVLPVCHWTSPWVRDPLPARRTPCSSR